MKLVRIWREALGCPVVRSSLLSEMCSRLRWDKSHTMLSSVIGFLGSQWEQDQVSLLSMVAVSKLEVGPRSIILQ